MSLTIEKLSALEILDSRGRPAVQVEAVLSGGARATAQVPSGASTGRAEALELRDGDTGRYGGLGVLRAVGHVETELAGALRGMAAEDQRAVDRRMIELDGTPDKSRLGANAILGVSCAVARAVAIARGVSLWRYLCGGRAAMMPVPMVNILSGGHHAAHNIEFQDFLAMPVGFDRYADALEAIVSIHAAAREVILSRGLVLTGVADEGGWGPYFESNEQALQIMVQAIERAGYRPGDQVFIALDVASSHFHRDSAYRLSSHSAPLSRDQMIDLLEDWSRRYPILSIEDGLNEEDWEGWPALTARLGEGLQLIGDDFFTTNPGRVRRGIQARAANSVLVKMNQIGTLTETFEVIDMAREAGWLAVISARSGETEDSFLADLAVASGAGQIKVGSITRSERLAKYNRLLEIEARGQLRYPGRELFRRFGR
jgi:enolase